MVLVRGESELLTWALGGHVPPDLSTVDELAGLQLAARRLGCSIQLRDASRELLALLELAGLDQVLTGAGSVVEAGREPEGGEQAGVEEVVMSDDPVA